MLLNHETFIFFNYLPAFFSLFKKSKSRIFYLNTFWIEKLKRGNMKGIETITIFLLAGNVFIISSDGLYIGVDIFHPCP